MSFEFASRLYGPLPVGPHASWLRVGLSFFDCGAQGAEYGGDFLGGFVFAARPEEAFQSIAFLAGDYVDVKMRNALADAIVGGDEDALSLHALLDGGSQHFYGGEKRTEQGIGQIVNGLQVAFGNHQAVSREQRAMVQEGQRGIIFVDHVILRGSAQNFAERAIGIEFIVGHGGGAWVRLGATRIRREPRRA